MKWKKYLLIKCQTIFCRRHSYDNHRYNCNWVRPIQCPLITRRLCPKAPLCATWLIIHHAMWQPVDTSKNLLTIYSVLKVKVINNSPPRQAVDTSRNLFTIHYVLKKEVCQTFSCPLTALHPPLVTGWMSDSVTLLNIRTERNSLHFSTWPRPRLRPW